MAEKDATSHLEDPGTAFDAVSAPVAVKMPGHGKEAQHADRHNADRPGSTIKHVGHSIPPARGQRHAPEEEKKGGHNSWGTNDPEEVLEDELGAGNAEVPVDFLKDESRKSVDFAIRDATKPDKEEAKTMTLDQYEKKIGHEV